MPFPETLTLDPATDFHVHLRDGPLCRAVTPTIRNGGVDTVYVMPNLVPPITTVAAARAYRERLLAISAASANPAAPVTFLMTLYLHPSLTAAEIEAAARDREAGIVGVKAYPAGVTTNSAAGFGGALDDGRFDDVFAAMERCGLVLNLHGEVPGGCAGCKGEKGEEEEEEEVTILNAEQKFLPTLLNIHAKFPKLRIVLEHATTAAALAAVARCGPSVAATVTAHHLWLTIDAVAGDPVNFCKPVAKMPGDRAALLRAVVGDGKGGGRVFFGSDSAPHVLPAKAGTGGGAAPQHHHHPLAHSAAAGCFTQPWAVQLVVGAVAHAVDQGWLSEHVAAPDADVDWQAVLDGFLSKRGRKFYGFDDGNGNAHGSGRRQKIVLEHPPRGAYEGGAATARGATARGGKDTVITAARIPSLLRSGRELGTTATTAGADREGGKEAEAEAEVVEIVPFRRGYAVWGLRWVDLNAGVE